LKAPQQIVSIAKTSAKAKADIGARRSIGQSGLKTAIRCNLI
tara:strand:+ start:269 stop:394 length:126 start_codon:yes stop_codon:yes gene_type:complete